MHIALFEGESRYGAVNSFTQALADAFSTQGVTPIRVDVRADRAALGQQLSKVCDCDDLIALLGFNTLGSTIRVDGQPLADALGVPFISYLVDHPLFHAEQLSHLANHPILCVDQSHVRFLEGHGYLQAHYLPHGGATPPDYYSAPRWAERPGRVLFGGSFEAADALRQRLAGVIADDIAAKDAGIPPLADAFQALADEGPFASDEELIDAANSHPTTFDVQQFLGISAHYTTLLRCLILWHRARARREMLTQLDRNGLAVDLVGDGWEQAGFTHHKVLGAKPFSEFHQLLAQYRFVLNIGPLFPEGLHDRIAYGALAGTVVCTDRNPVSEGLITPGGAVGFTPGDVSTLPADIARLDGTPEGAAMAAMGREIAMFDHTWGTRARQIMRILGR